MGKHKQIKAIDPFCPKNRKERNRRDEKKKESRREVHLGDLEQVVPKSYVDMMRRIDDMNKTKEEKQREREEKQQESMKRRKEAAHKKEERRKQPKAVIEPQKPYETTSMFMRRRMRTINSSIEDFKIKMLTDDNGDLERKGKKKKTDNQKRRLDLVKKNEACKKVYRKLDRLEKEFGEDKVAFGEVNSRPPNLTKKPRGSQVTDTKMGGRTFLLNSMMAAQQRSGPTRRTKKRKKMTLHERKVFDDQHSAAVESYRRVKNKNKKN